MPSILYRSNKRVFCHPGCIPFFISRCPTTPLSALSRCSCLTISFFSVLVLLYLCSNPFVTEAYAGWKTKVLCHDCERYTEVPYHFYYLKVYCSRFGARATFLLSNHLLLYYCL